MSLFTAFTSTHMTQACSPPKFASPPTYSAGTPSDLATRAAKSACIAHTPPCSRMLASVYGLSFSLHTLRLRPEHLLVVLDVLVDGADAGPLLEVLARPPSRARRRACLWFTVWTRNSHGSCSCGPLSFVLPVEDVLEVVDRADLRDACRAGCSWCGPGARGSRRRRAGCPTRPRRRPRVRRWPSPRPGRPSTGRGRRPSPRPGCRRPGRWR